MANEINIDELKSRGLTCSKLKSMEKKQLRDAQSDVKDAQVFRGLGFSNQAEKQEAIAKAQRESADAIKSLRKQVCLLK